MIKHVIKALRLESQGEMSQQLDKYFVAFFDEMEIDRGIAEKLGDLLKFSGFHSIEQTRYTIPVGEWPTAKGKKVSPIFSFFSFLN
jgi:hypothetical protein